MLTPYYNGSKNFLFVFTVKIDQLKEKVTEIK